MIDTKKHVRSCAICQQTYRYCNNCSEYDHLPAWMLRWCSENCKDLDNIISSYGMHEISASEAAKQLKSIDTSRMEFWPESYQRVYARIMTEVNGDEPKPSPVDEAKAETEKMLSISEELKNSSKKKTSKSHIVKKTEPDVK